ncbi:hypothetical protein [Roseomonas gilardii]|uniref:hypothetical protein n=1 Tax=Roseomonas gilardii TaxID=257708 RepID=UPI00048159A4|nr:hypothetical protein [Roseomonas gilardii]
MMFIFINTLLGCAPGDGRARQPVADTTPLDAQLSCSHLQGEYEMNRRRLAELGEQEAGRGAANMGRIMTYGVVFGAAVLHESGAPYRAEGASLRRRNARLMSLAAEKSCQPLL